MTIFKGKYEYSLNSPDIHDSHLSLDKSRAFGGTLAMWKSSLDPYVTVLEAPSSSILPLLLKLPGYKSSCHIGTYLPTAGQDEQFISALSDLDSTLLSVHEKYGLSTKIFIRWDMNVSSRNCLRLPLLNHFLERHSLNKAVIPHPTYHHFVGYAGEFDSDLDVILHQAEDYVNENVVFQVCKHECQLVDSHHDLLVSRMVLPKMEVSVLPPPHQAPRIPNERVKIIWSEDGIAAYQNLLQTHLDDLAQRWSNESSTSSISILLTATNEILKLAAMETNKFIDLSRSVKQKPVSNPALLNSRNKVLKIHRQLGNLNSSCSLYERQRLQDELCAARSTYRRNLREVKLHNDNLPDSQLSAYASDPSSIFEKIRQSNNIKSGSLPKLQVDEMIFDSQNVCDGFHKSLSMLKSPDMSSIESSVSFQETFRDFTHIMELVKCAERIPPIQIHESIDILYSVKQEVNDLNSITAGHFIHAGSAGLRHFHLLMSAFINNLNNSNIQELNDIWACVLYKGHRKDKENHRSYRTISTCTL